MISSILSGIAEKMQLKRGNGRWYGACPECGGSNSSDRFDLRDDGGYLCRACHEVRGDVVKLLRTYGGMNCPEAYIALGRECTLTTCPGREKCRLGDGSGDRTPRRREPLSPPTRVARDLPVTQVTMPKPQWLTWATALLEKAQADLQEQPEVLAWLAKRGIDAAAVNRFGLGWLKHDRRVDRQTIGLQPKQGKSKLWVPGGLLIPIFDGTGQLHRLRVRRTDEARDKFLPELKYVWLDGSGTGPLVIRPQGAIRGAVILEAELDSFASAAAHPEVMVIGLGSVGIGLPPRLMTELDVVATILVALDADRGKDGAAGAGPKAVNNWKRRYRQAKFWPTPAGKDVGNYAEIGGNLTAWVEAGLVPRVAARVERPAIQPQQPGELCPPPPSDQDVPFPPLCSQPGGRGKEDISQCTQKKQQKSMAADIAAARYLAQIEELPEPVLSDALAIHSMMSAHPVYPWLSADGMECGILASGDWKQQYREISARFTKLFYGPAHEPVCRIYRDQFVATAKLHKKGPRV
jgi:hypothetical protein